LLKLSIDIKLPNLYIDNPEKITKPIEQLSLELSNRIVNGVINIDIQKYHEHSTHITLLVIIVASNTSIGNLELENELTPRLSVIAAELKNEIFDFSQNVTTNQITCAFKLNLHSVHKHKGMIKSLPFENKRILIAEDNEINAMVFSSFLDEWGCESIIVSNGREAVSYIENSSVDLILMDIYMPVLNGIDATKEIRKIKLNIPIIAVTASTLEADRVNARSAGTNDLLLKPVSSSSLFQVLSKYL